MQAKRGFTLVEILIVVVILGILAAIVIPQFTQASSEAKLNSLCSDLQSMRSQIELYKVQHNDVAPGNIVTTGVAAASIGSLDEQLIYCTDIDGNVKTGTDARVRDTGSTAVYVYGPYLERIPDNPFNNMNTINTAACGNPATAASGTFGWQYDPTTGGIFADDSGETPEGVSHYEL